MDQLMDQIITVFSGILVIMLMLAMVAFPIVVPIVIFKIYKAHKKKKDEDNLYTTYTYAVNPYLSKKYIFTNSEFACYKNMKIVADKYGLEIFCKVRFADLIDTRQGKDFNKWFNRVKSKHIDFVLLDGKTITPKLLIELDDSTHNREDRKKRDQFVDAVCAMCGLKIRHIKNYGTEYIENILLEENITNIPVQ